MIPLNRLEDLARRKRIPGATYRLQFNRHFTFRDATRLAEYLRDLGITDGYASPLFQATPHSTHGYDVCAPDQLNPNLGRPADFETFSARLRELGLGLILDLVPNHMGSDLTNCWWRDVLEKGRASAFANYFDINWNPPQPELQNKILVPVLEADYALVLESGKLRLDFQNGFCVRYYERAFPLAPHSYATILESVAQALHGGGTDEAREKLKALIAISRAWEQGAPLDLQQFPEFKTRLQQAHDELPVFREHLEAVFNSLNGTPGSPRSFNRLDQLLRAQHYRLAHWRVGHTEINYRRFFDVPELVSLKVERPEVFEACHAFALRLLAKQQVTGLRLDHPDGLWNPQAYFHRLQKSFLLARLGPAENKAGAELEAEVSRWLDEQLAHRAAGNESERRPPVRPEMGADSQGHAGPEAGAPNATASTASFPPCYVLAEKILTNDEPLPRNWAVDGTTGYEFLNCVNGLFVNQTNEQALDRIHREFTGWKLDYATTVYTSKRRILNDLLISELNSLTHRLKSLAARTRYGRDFTFRQFHAALAGMIAAFPVYRTYLHEHSTELSAQDRTYIAVALREATARNPRLPPRVFQFIEDLLLLRPPADLDAAGQKLGREFVMRFQQITSPVMAKGVEDTTFYNYNRLTSLNEVGGHPDQFGVSVEQFHHSNQQRQAQWPHSMLTTSTHDTKRGEDVRARINVLSELAGEWNQALTRWSRLNADKKQAVDGQPAPQPNDEYFLYQTLLGAWPASGSPDDEFRERILAYMLKAVREAKWHTNWLEPNLAYEEALNGFIRGLLDPADGNAFLKYFLPFQRRIAFFGQFNSYSQTLLKLTAPGVPDIYQGAELWDLSLVDPDNRRPVDFDLRRQMLAEMKAELARQPLDLPGFSQSLLTASQTGRLKLYLTSRALGFRNQHRSLFQVGDYVPLSVTGAKAEHVCAFARQAEDASAVVIAPRLAAGLTNGTETPPIGPDVWADTAVNLSESGAADWHNIFTGETVRTVERDGKLALRLADTLKLFPVALLERVE